jgi:hypothetical protein
MLRDGETARDNLDTPGKPGAGLDAQFLQFKMQWACQDCAHVLEFVRSS